MKKLLAVAVPVLVVAFVIAFFGRESRLVALALAGSIARGAVPLLLCGLCVAIGFKAGVFNLGAEGQLVAGALAATAVGVHGGPAFVLVPSELLAGALAGAAWGGIAAWLKRSRGAPEVLTTILLNFVAIQLGRFLIDYGNPLNEAAHAYVQSDAIAKAGELAPLRLLGLELPKGILLACALALALDAALLRTRPGLELRLAGASPSVARAQGFSPARALWTAFLLGGALSGLAGALAVAEITHRFYWTFAEGAGYTAVAVALVADLRPAGVALAALAFAALETGAQAAQRQHGVPKATAFAIEGIVVLAVLAQGSVAARMRARAEAREPDGGRGAEPRARDVPA